MPFYWCYAPGENRLICLAKEEVLAVSAPDSTDEPIDAAERPPESVVDIAKGDIAKAENDTANARKKVEKSAEQVRQVFDGQDSSPEKVQERIDKLNERQQRFKATLPEEFLRKTFAGQVFETLRFGISEDGRTYESADFDSYRTTFSLSQKQRRFKVLREDKDGKVYGFREGQGRARDGIPEHELREDGIRIYLPIDVLEKDMNEAEVRYTTEKIKDDPKYADLFNERNDVRAVKGRVADGSINLDKPPEEFNETALKAKQFRAELKKTLDQMPESAKQTAMLRMIAGSDFAVDRDGKMLMVFSPDHGSEFRALSQRIFKGLVGHTSIDEAGHYAVEVAPGSVPQLIARLRIIFLFTNESMTFEEMQENLEIIRNGTQIETPSVIKEQAEMLNGRLRSIATDGDAKVSDSPAGRFLSDMQFDADETGRLTFSHKSAEAVSRYFQQIDDSDSFESSNEIFKGIRLKMKDGTFHSNDLSLERATQLIEKLRNELRSPVKETTENEEKPAEED